MKALIFLLTLVSQLSADPNVLTFASTKSEVLKEGYYQDYEGLKDLGELDRLLEEQNYTEVLKHLWSEADAQKRRAWLEEKIATEHPILFFELAEESYLENPTLECYVTRAMPWIIAGATRTLLDARCAQDTHCLLAAEELMATYQQRILGHVLTKYTLEEIEEYVLEHHNEFLEENRAIQRKAFTPITEDKTLPSPKWVFEGESKVPENQFDAVRRRGALEILGML